ncbi:GIY-YIG nuclease family protein [Zobellella sp. An-6]|uniref:GIY-YIG nuclease family protein n=1 Tax=Zobellella sp. An-6 TaxID=3400218 RepID=UPI00404318EB
MDEIETAPGSGADTWFVYLLRCRDHSLYAGITLDPERRCREHNRQRSQASRYVWARRPAMLAWQLAVADKNTALKLEYRLKRLTRKQKEQLLQDPEGWRQLLC